MTLNRIFGYGLFIGSGIATCFCFEVKAGMICFPLWALLAVPALLIVGIFGMWLASEDP